MTDHSTDPFDIDNISETQRAAGLNSALHIFNGLSEAEKLNSGVKGLLENADAVSRFLYDGTVPSE